MGSREGTTGSGAGRAVRRPIPMRPPHPDEELREGDPLVNRWQDGPWVGRYPLAVQPGEEDEAGHRPVRPFTRRRP